MIIHQARVSYSRFNGEKWVNGTLELDGKDIPDAAKIYFTNWLETYRKTKENNPAFGGSETEKNSLPRDP